MDKIISIEGLCKSFGRHDVLNGLDLTVEKGEFAVIKGKSGSGKSTLLNVIGLLDGFEKGVYRFGGKDISRGSVFLKDSIRAENLGFVFQSYCLIPNMSVEDNILMPIIYCPKLKYTNNLQKRLDKYINDFGLADIRKKKAKYLSGGEKQRTAIIRALIKNPDVIVADEPTGNLDPENSRVIYKEFKNLTKEGKAIVVVTHSDSVFENVDSIYSLSEGRLYETV